MTACGPEAPRDESRRQWARSAPLPCTLWQRLPADTDVRITREFYAVYAAEELARLHRKYSPVAHLFAEEEGG